MFKPETITGGATFAAAIKDILRNKMAQEKMDDDLEAVYIADERSREKIDAEKVAAEARAKYEQGMLNLSDEQFKASKKAVSHQQAQEVGNFNRGLAALTKVNEVEGGSRDFEVGYNRASTMVGAKYGKEVRDGLYNYSDNQMNRNVHAHLDAFLEALNNAKTFEELRGIESALRDQVPSLKEAISELDSEWWGGFGNRHEGEANNKFMQVMRAHERQKRNLVNKSQQTVSEVNPAQTVNQLLNMQFKGKGKP